MLIVPCALIMNEGKLLVARRPINKDQGGKWESPGGKADEGETEQEALIREVMEELGIWVYVGDKVCETECHPPETKQPCRVSFYLCRVVSADPTRIPEPQPLAASELRWVTATEFLALDLCIANHKCRDQIAAVLGS